MDSLGFYGEFFICGAVLPLQLHPKNEKSTCIYLEDTT
jgi:hypothetical protein